MHTKNAGQMHPDSSKTLVLYKSCTYLLTYLRKMQRQSFMPENKHVNMSQWLNMVQVGPGHCMFTGLGSTPGQAE